MRLILGDSLVELAKLEPESVHAMVTDPPAGIGFMGKAFDSDRGGRDNWIAWLAGFMELAYRALKPGAHGLVWALPRTSHWTATALENAGFEIRDVIMSIFGSGFPKSLNVSKSLDGVRCACDNLSAEDLRGVQQAMATRDALSVGTESDMLADMRGATDSGDAAGNFEAAPNLQAMRNPVHTEEQHVFSEGEVLQLSMCGTVEGAESRRAGSSSRDGSHGADGMDSADSRDYEKENDRREQPVLARGDHIQAHKGELRQDQNGKMPDRIHRDGETRRICGGAQAGRGTDCGPVADESGSCPSYRSRSDEQQDRKSGTVAGQPLAQAGGAWSICARCGKPAILDGLGTALKPAAEHWILVRKPLAGTVAETVTRYGTGGINVASCRVAGAPPSVPQPQFNSPTGAVYGFKCGEGRSGEMSQAAGRWPPHLILSHSASCGDKCVDGCPILMMDEQSGWLQTGRVASHSTKAAGVPFGSGADVDYADSEIGGGSSRFFPRFRYCPKPSRAEREAGCEQLPGKERAELTGRGEDSPGLVGSGDYDGSPRTGANWKGEIRNHHPTLKSIELMRWLCRLITPPGGTVLDPFMGSGTTGCACACEGFEFIGIDDDPDYVQIARARIEHYSAERHEVENDDRERPQGKGQTTLW